jgi:CNT family concentrative nucleoside transporter
LNIAAMLISFLALIALVNGIFGGIHNHVFHWFPSSLEQVFGVIFAPIAFVIGIPWHECGIVGNLLGTRMVINELVAYGMLGAQKGILDPRSFAIATFALCGFANFSSIGIQIGGISALAPNKRGELAKLGFRAMIAGTMANLMSASIVGILLR